MLRYHMLAVNCSMSECLERMTEIERSDLALGSSWVKHHRTGLACNKRKSSRSSPWLLCFAEPAVAAAVVSPLVVSARTGRRITGENPRRPRRRLCGASLTPVAEWAPINDFSQFVVTETPSRHAAVLLAAHPRRLLPLFSNGAERVL